jgi:DNA repair protein RecN (Recombination protein N)
MPRAQLVELYAYRLGVIDEARLEFGEGFNVITGETGAGKTLLVGALGLCLGADAGASRYALTPETRAVAVFVRERDELVVAREASASGRLRSSLNGAPSSVEALRGLAEGLVVMHGQHDSLTLRNRAEIVRVIDRYGAVDTGELEEVRRQLREARRLRLEFGGDREARQREIEFVVYQLDELEGAVLGAPEELADTLAELTRLTSLREGQAALAEVLERFEGEADESVLTQFARALTRLPDGDVYEAARTSLRGALDEAREALRDLAALTDPDVLDGRRLVELEARVTQLQFIARKYGGTLAAALATRDELRVTARRQASDTDRLEGLDQEIQDLESLAVALAERVKEERERAAHSLTTAIERQLTRVALANATLRAESRSERGSAVGAREWWRAESGAPRHLTGDGRP